jgi:dTDP-4-dehydrorhamnose reductase
MCHLYTFRSGWFVYIVGMKILITGGNGFLGQHLCRSLKDQYKIIATGKGERRLPFKDVEYVGADITSADALKQLIHSTAPDVVIHTAAMSKPDECDKNRELCIDINIKGTKNLIEAVQEFDRAVHFIYTSSDFVLGDDGPHNEEATPAPLNFYGESKLEAERIVTASDLLWSVVRPVFMYGETWEGLRPTFLHWVKESLENGRQIKVVCDQQRTPTYVGDICKGIDSIIQKRAGGLFHLAGEEVLTPYHMALRFAAYLGLDTSLIEAVSSATFTEPVQRAKKGGLIIDKARSKLSYDPVGFDEGIKALFNSKHTIA